MPVLLARLVAPARHLWRAYPPRVHHPAKQVFLDAVGGLAREPRGTLTITRWAPETQPPASSVAVSTGTRTGAEASGETAVRHVLGPMPYPPAEAGTTSWHVNFADDELFGFYGGLAFGQDEIQVAEHPVLASVRHALEAGAAEPSSTSIARTRERGRATPVLVRGAERYGAIDLDPPLAEPFGIYGRRLAKTSEAALRQAVERLDRAEASGTNVLAMAAPRGVGAYTAEQIEDIVETAVTAFSAARAESPASTRLRVWTGHWGTGAFGGDRVLMVAAQIVAARATGIDELVFCSFDDEAERALDRGRALADHVVSASSSSDPTNSGALSAALAARGFVWGTPDGN
jgi:hypothetical protein